MFDLGWSEILVIAIIALVVVGPKDLPNLLRMVGRWTRQARGIARNFQGAMDQMVRESELADLKREFDGDMTSPPRPAPQIMPPRPQPADTPEPDRTDTASPVSEPAAEPDKLAESPAPSGVDAPPQGLAEGPR